MGDGSSSDTVGFLRIFRYVNNNTFDYRYANGITAPAVQFNNFFQDLDNQWIHIVTVCDYMNKTFKAYRNGVQFSTTQTLSGTPVFPSTNRIKYVGAYGSTQYKLTDGSLDEVRIYNRGLSAEEISAQYTNTRSRYGQ